MQDMYDLTGLTPAMKQYVEVKREYADAIVLFQVGDFYEIFFEDAKKVAEFLGIALTKRGEYQGVPIPLCGFPLHAVDHYVPRLVKGGFKIALCDQLEPAVTGKMVARGVTNVLTPGTLVADNLLDAKSSSYLFSFFPTKSGFGLLFSELLTSQLYATILPFGAHKQLETELFRFLPDEVVLLQNKAIQSYESFFKQRSFFTTTYNLDFDQTLVEQETQWLQSHLDQQSFATLQQHTALLYATIMWKKYVQKTQQKALEHVKSIVFYEPESFLMLDSATQKNLDLVKNSFDGSRQHTLLSLMDKAVTPMGSRMIKRWLLTPLVDRSMIEHRQKVVGFLKSNKHILQQLVEHLEKYGDMQRVVGRMALDRSVLHDYVALGRMTKLLPVLQELLWSSSNDELICFAQSIPDFTKLSELLSQACEDDPLSQNLIKVGYDQSLDRMRDLVQNGSHKILELEQQEITRTGIGSLKIRHNNLQGYFIEITKTNLDSVPQDYVEMQMLVNRKRFTTKHLQALQIEITHAQQQYTALEKEIFEQVKVKVKHYLHDLRIVGQTLATIDGLVGFGRVAYEYGWAQPEFHDGCDIVIRDGKHPIVAATLQEKFVLNNTDLTDQQSLWIITGPNMGGKSTYLRQVALICLLAQTGSFVPASTARLPMLDRIFTRIGAGDFLAQGKSTFLVEMEETSQILQQATYKSLVILDEVGRGTSTYDGLALAQAIIEYLVQHVKARCLFATHYHELTDLQNHFSSVASFYADSVQTPQGIIFLHKMVAGKADGSFGIEVAKLAHIPLPVIQRASELLKRLDQDAVKLKAVQRSDVDAGRSMVEPATIDPKSKLVLDKIKLLRMEHVTPKMAMDVLWELHDLVKT